MHDYNVGVFLNTVVIPHLTIVISYELSVIVVYFFLTGLCGLHTITIP